MDVTNNNNINENNELDNQINYFLCRVSYNKEKEQQKFNLDDSLYMYLLETPVLNNDDKLDSQANVDLKRNGVYINNNFTRDYEVFKKSISHLDKNLQKNIKLILSQSFLVQLEKYIDNKLKIIRSYISQSHSITNYLNINQNNINIKIEYKVSYFFRSNNSIFFTVLTDNIINLNKNIYIINYYYYWNSKFNYLKNFINLIGNKINTYTFTNNYNQKLFDEILYKIEKKLFPDNGSSDFNNNDFKNNCIEYYNKLLKINWVTSYDKLIIFLGEASISFTFAKYILQNELDKHTINFSTFLFEYLSEYIKDRVIYDNLKINLNIKEIDNILLPSLNQINLKINSEVINPTTNNNNKILKKINALTNNSNYLAKLKLILSPDVLERFSVNIFRNNFFLDKIGNKIELAITYISNNTNIGTTKYLIVNTTIILNLKYKNIILCIIEMNYHIDITNDIIIIQYKQNCKNNNSNIKNKLNKLSKFISNTGPFEKNQDKINKSINSLKLQLNK
jgi:hypothetical protein